MVTTAKSPTVQSTAPSHDPARAANTVVIWRRPRCDSPRPRTVSMNDAPELPPQARDEHFDGVRIAIEALRVDVLGQLALRHDATAMVHQVGQHAELVAGQLHRHAVERHLRRAESSATAPHRSSGVTCRWRAGSARAAARALPPSGTASTRSRRRRRRCPAPSRASCRARSAPAPALRSRRRASGRAASARRSSGGRGRGRRRRSARSARGNRRARRRARSPRRSRPRRARPPAASTGSLRLRRRAPATAPPRQQRLRSERDHHRETEQRRLNGEPVRRASRSDAARTDRSRKRAPCPGCSFSRSICPPVGLRRRPTRRTGALSV